MKYKLVNAKTFETVTYADEPIQFGGEWGSVDTEGNPLYVWGENIPLPSEILAETKAEKLAEVKAKLTDTDYKCLKFVDGDLTEEEYALVKEQRHKYREAYNSIEAATTVDEVNAVSY